MLHHGAHNGEIEFVKNDVNAIDSKGFTALHRAVRNDDPERVKQLLAVDGINVNVKDRWDSEATPLHWTSNLDNIEILKLLLDFEGIDVNATARGDDDGSELSLIHI